VGPRVEKQRRKGPECINGIKGKEIRWQLCLRKERTFGRVYRKAVELENEISRIYLGLWVRAWECLWDVKLDEQRTFYVFTFANKYWF
jgi:hypothetical protein